MKDFDEQVRYEYEDYLRKMMEDYGYRTPPTDYDLGICKGLQMALEQFQISNTAQSMQQQPATKCYHYWIKLAPIGGCQQKYMCLNCDEVKG